MHIDENEKTKIHRKIEKKYCYAFIFLKARKFKLSVILIKNILRIFFQRQHFYQ